MQDQDLAAFEEGQDIFRPSFEAQHQAALDPLREVGREGEAQIVAGEPHLADALASEHAFEAAHHGFDFWQFRHGSTVRPVWV